MPDSSSTSGATSVGLGVPPSTNVNGLGAGIVQGILGSVGMGSVSGVTGSQASANSAGSAAGSTGLDQALAALKGVLAGLSSGSAIPPGLTVSMDKVQELLTKGLTTGQTPGTSTSTTSFQGMASALSHALTGSSSDTAILKPVLDALNVFLTSAKSGSSDSATLVTALNTFLASVSPGSSNATQPLQTMIGVVKKFLSSNSQLDAASATAAFQDLLDVIHKDLLAAKVLSGPASSHAVKILPSGEVEVSGSEGTTTLSNMTRLHFSDKSVATDISGNAGKAAKILGLVFGADQVANKTYAGIGLDLLDKGMSYEDLMQTALTAKLGANYTTADEVTLAYKNLLGTTPSANDLKYWENAVASGQFTHGSLGVMAADLDLNKTNINLVGLAQTGLEFTPVIS